MSRQYLACVFKPGGRAYSYHNDGMPCAAGDLVRVEGRNGAEQRVEVVGTTDEPPPFETKPILGRAEAINSAEEDQHAR